MTDTEKNKLFIEQTSPENPQETPAAMMKANDEEAKDKNEMPVENDEMPVENDECDFLPALFLLCLDSSWVSCLFVVRDSSTSMVRAQSLRFFLLEYIIVTNK